MPRALSELIAQLVNATFTFHCAGVCPHHSCLLSIVRGFRQGVVYGAKIRFPHALVMTFLFRGGSLSDKASAIATATYTHARSLGAYAALYKLLTCALRHTTGQSTQSSPFIPLTSGFIAGALMFGRSSPITTQINMYGQTHATHTHRCTPATSMQPQPPSTPAVSTIHPSSPLSRCARLLRAAVMSRVMFGLLRLLVVKGVMGDWEKGSGYVLYAGVVWALVMVLFEMRPAVLQKSLASSMEYLYHDSDRMPRKDESWLDWIIREV